MMILDENEVIPFLKSQWNALCKNGILLNTAFLPLKIDFVFAFCGISSGSARFAKVPVLRCLESTMFKSFIQVARG